MTSQLNFNSMTDYLLWMQYENGSVGGLSAERRWQSTLNSKEPEEQRSRAPLAALSHQNGKYVLTDNSILQLSYYLQDEISSCHARIGRLEAQLKSQCPKKKNFGYTLLKWSLVFAAGYFIGFSVGMDK